MDYCVVGGGPAGLTAALQLSRAGKSVVLIDENDTLGGCHRVVRKDKDLFSEHAPRVYSNAYLNTAALLQSMATSFEQQFVPYNFSVSSIGAGGILRHLSLREMAWLAWSFLTESPESAQQVSMAGYMAQHAFSDVAREYVDRLCLLTDGADASRYSLWEFMELANQQALYSLFQPRQPTDTGLFDVWRKALLSSGCTIIQRQRIESVLLPYDSIGKKHVKFQDGSILQADVVILAVPPMSALPLMQVSVSKVLRPSDSSMVDWKSLVNLSKATQYNTYVPVSLHFDKPLPDSVSRVYGFPWTPWGIAFVVLSDYFCQDNNSSGDSNCKGLISTTITLPNVLSPHTGISANDSTEEQLVTEVIRQLQQQLPDMPTPSKAFVTPGVTHVPSKGWHNPNSAYVAAAGTCPWGPETDIPGLYSLGSHNGNSAYSFTSMESAVTNALTLTNRLEPSTAVELLKPWTLRLYLVMAAAVLVSVAMLLL